ncbi:M23 family metallopeptidase [Spirillospora sp. NPDC048911]|uniref:M23 family metallopeptidase n=1 Tax=Spirillospora sp. NPDC048911 TaxID=3364527 RepID=UPI00371EFF8F
MTLVTPLLACAVIMPAVPDPWHWPLGPAEPRIVRGFSPPPDPWSAGHRGIDLAARPGQPVYAAGSGRVSYTGRLAGRGVIAITHGPLRTTYLPVRSALALGSPVKAGTRIGVVEAFQGHCVAEPCLHWGLLKGRTYLDPLTLVRPRIRLLPLWPSRPWPPSTPAPPYAPTPPYAPAPRPAPGLPPGPGLPASPAPALSLSPSPSPAAARPKGPPPYEPEPRLDLRDATTATGGAIAGMLLAFALSLTWRTTRALTRRKPSTDVIDLAQERRQRRRMQDPGP